MPIYGKSVCSKGADDNSNANEDQDGVVGDLGGVYFCDMEPKAGLVGSRERS